MVYAFAYDIAQIDETSNVVNQKHDYREAL